MISIFGMYIKMKIERYQKMYLIWACVAQGSHFRTGLLTKLLSFDANNVIKIIQVEKRLNDTPIVFNLILGFLYPNYPVFFISFPSLVPLL